MDDARDVVRQPRPDNGRSHAAAVGICFRMVEYRFVGLTHRIRQLLRARQKLGRTRRAFRLHIVERRNDGLDREAACHLAR
jgi:hypothetical protein